MTLVDKDCAQPNSAEGTGEIFHYRAFGLNVRSDLPIVELTPATIDVPAHVDLEIVTQVGKRPFASSADQFDFQLHDTTDGTDYLFWLQVGTFRIVGDSRIECDPNPGVGSDLISLPLLGIVMAVLLHRRGLMVLHGSAVKINDRAVIFLGDKGAGKSTTAASLAAAGRSILTDDVVALERMTNGDICLLPGHAQVKLSQDATESIDLSDARVLDKPFELYDKHRHVFETPFDTDPVGVADIFVLERGGLGAVPLKGADAFTALMRYSYLARFGSEIFKGENATHFLHWCADVSRTIPVGKLTVPSDLSGLKRLDNFLQDRARAASDRP